MKNIRRILAITLAVSLMAVGCGSSSSSDSDSTDDTAAEETTEEESGEEEAEAAEETAESSDSDEEQVLRVSMAGSPSDINPLTATTTEASELLGCMYEGLVRQNADGEILEGSGLAESWEISDDGTVYTFTLRDATWSDGEEITADQFVYCWEQVLNPATASEYAYMLYVIVGAEEYNTGELTDFDEVGVKALDDKTLEVTLLTATDYFLEMLVIPQYGALPVGFVEEVGSNIYLDPEYMVFNGPFIMTEWEPDVSMTFVKNENYWDADSVSLDVLEFNFVMETNTIVNLYETDQLDVMLVQAEFLSTYQDDAGFISIVEPVTEYLKFNYDNVYFANENIRRAFSMSLDRITYMEYLATGSTGAYAYVPDSIHGPNGEGFREAYGDLYYDIGTNDGALEEAQELLALGLEEVGSTIEEFNASGVSLVIGEGDTNLKTAQIFQEFWKNNLGIDVEIRSMAYALRQEAYDSDDWTIGKEGWGADYNDAQSFLELFETDSPYNDTGYSSEEFDSLMDQAKASTGDERLALLQEAEKVLVGDDQCIAPTFFQTRSWVAKDNVSGIVRQGIGLRVDYKWVTVE